MKALTKERAEELEELFDNLETGGLREQIYRDIRAIVEAKKKLEVLYIDFAKEHMLGDDAEALEKLISFGWQESEDFCVSEPLESVERSDAIETGIRHTLWNIE